MTLSHLGRYVGAPGRLVLGAVFPLLRRFKPARERVVLGEYGDDVEHEHVARYEFARRYCAGKRVADIACGSGYGTDILRQVAANVDGYDRVPLCGNIVLDLEKEVWNTQYDVIVSFETIEHLANPDFFLANATRTSPRLIVSSPIGEFRGYNPHHKQTWELPQFQALLEPRFDCRYFYQEGVSIADTPTAAVSFVIAVCDRRSGPA